MSSSSGGIPPPAGSTEQTTCLTADFNLDGIDDIIVGSRGPEGSVQAWLSSEGGEWRRVDVENGNVEPEAGGAVHDIDNDGDPDIVIGQNFKGGNVFWWENPNPDFAGSWPRHVVKSGGATKHHDQAFGYFDGDGAVELVSWNQNAGQLLLFDIPPDPRSSADPWPAAVIFSAPNRRYEGLAVGDVDLDGVDDIIGAGRWWKHVEGAYQAHVVDADMAFTRAAVGQLIPGGRPEIVYIPGDANGNGYWYEWDGSTWNRHLIAYIYNGHSVEVRDVDADGAMDLFVGEMKLGSTGCRLRIYYGDNSGSFSAQVIATGNGIHEGRLADLDGDGDLDIVHKPFNDGTPRLDLWFNQRQPTLSLDRWQTHLIDRALPAQSVFVDAADLNGDGLTDLVGGGWWWQNPGNLSGLWVRNEIQPGGFLNFAGVIDVDGDGDLDLFGTRAPGANPSANFSWAENRGPLDLLVHQNIESGRGTFLQGIAVGRFAGPGGPLEIALSWHSAATGIQMLTIPETDPTLATWRWRSVSTVSLGEDLSTGDVDGDRDQDLVLGTLWLENPGWTPHAIGAVDDLRGYGGRPEPDRNRLADLDGDGDPDVVIGLERGREIVWFENPRPAGKVRESWKRRILGAFEGQGFSMDVADFDRDGDPDIVVGEHKGSTHNRVLLMENDGTGSNWPVYVVDRQLSGTIDHHDGTIAVDIDNDGDLDIVSTGWSNAKIWVFENLAVDGGTP